MYYVLIGINMHNYVLLYITMYYVCTNMYYYTH